MNFSVPSPLIRYTFNQVISNGTTITNNGTSGSTNNGTSTNATSSSTYAHNATYSLRTTATSTYVSINNGVTMDSRGYSVCFWLYVSPVVQFGGVFEFVTSDGSAQMCYMTTYNQDTGDSTKVRLQWSPDITYGSGNINAYNVSTAQWHHIAAIADSSKNVYLYVDGVLQSSSYMSGILAGNTSRSLTYIGADTWQTPNLYMNDFRYYQTALLPYQVLYLYSNT